MSELRRLDPHDPLPDGKFIAVLRRFDEDNPRETMIELIVADGSGLEHNSRAQDADGRLLDYEDAIQAALRQAEREHFPCVYGIDRLAGPREQSILSHNGDHSAGSMPTEDADLEEGRHGTDLRDRR